MMIIMGGMALLGKFPAPDISFDTATNTAGGWCEDKITGALGLWKKLLPNIQIL